MSPELGILCRGDMVRAILARAKRQTRRAVKAPRVRLARSVASEPILFAVGLGTSVTAGAYPATLNRHGAVSATLADGKPFGLRPGEFDFLCRWGEGRTVLADYGDGRKAWTILPGAFRRLWVRETWAPHPTETQDPAERICYRADRAVYGPVETQPAHVNRRVGSPDDDPGLAEPKWRPSLLMPRWASRTTLRVTAIRMERLTEITPDDVIAEGFEHAGLGTTPADYCREYRAMHKIDDAADPFVWVLDFEVVEC